MFGNLPSWVDETGSLAQGLIAIVTILGALGTVMAVAVRFAMRGPIAKIHKRIDDHMNQEEVEVGSIKADMSDMAQNIAYIAGKLGVDQPAPSRRD